MAKRVLTLLFLTSVAMSINIEKHDNTSFVRSLNPKKAPLLLGQKQQKLSHFHFYWHDIVSGRRPSAAVVVPPLSNSSAAAAATFGMVAVIDDPLTVGPEPSSKLVGRAQGLYASTAQREMGLTVAMNLAFVEGKYNGSTITIVGRNAVMSEVREMPVVGGSGLLRFAKGFVRVRTHKFDLNTGDAIVEYNAYVLHY